MRIVRLPALVFALASALALVSGSSASASCIGPSISFTPVSVARGDEIVVTGQGWGDACHDTGPDVPTDSVLGKPRRDVELVFAQDGRDIVVGRGAADHTYSFHAKVTVPSGLHPGVARLYARAGGLEATDLPSRPPLVIADAPAPAGPVEVTTFGPAAARAPNHHSGGGTTTIVVVVLALAVAGSVGAVLLRRRQRSARHGSP
jgi:hypothetical protein